MGIRARATTAPLRLPVGPGPTQPAQGPEPPQQALAQALVQGRERPQEQEQEQEPVRAQEPVQGRELLLLPPMRQPREQAQREQAHQRPRRRR